MRVLSLYRLLLWVVGALVAMVVVGACRREATPSEADLELREIDSIIDEAPDEALARVRAVDTTAFRLPESQALRALLLTQAEDKNYIDSDRDTLISRASIYYSLHPELDSSRRIRAHYYHARVLSNAGHCAQAMEELYKACELALEYENYMLLGHIYSQIAALYNVAYNYEESINALKTAINYYHRANDYDYCIYTQEELSTAYLNAKHYELALDIVDSIKCRNVPLDILPNVLRTEAIANYQLGNIELSKAAYDNLEVWNNRELMTSLDFTNLADIYLYEEKNDSVLACLMMAESMAFSRNDSANILFGKIKYSISTENMQELQINLNAFMNMLNDAWISSAKDNPSVGLSNHFYSKSEQEKTKKEFYKGLFVLILCGSIFVALICYVLFVKYKNRKETEMMLLLTRYREIVEKQDIVKTNDVCKDREVESRLRPVVSLDELSQILYKNRFEYVNSLSKRIFNSVGSSYTDSRAKIILNDCKTVFTSIGSESSILELEKLLNLYENDIVIHLDESYPLLKVEDRRILILIFAGLSLHAICLVLNMNSLEYFRTRKSRIKRIISNSDSVWKEDFLSHF